MIPTIAKFNTLGAAKRHQEHATKIVMLVLGDDGLIWSVTPAVGERLVRQGFEYAEPDFEWGEQPDPYDPKRTDTERFRERQAHGLVNPPA